MGEWSPASTTVGVAILLHMMPVDRRSWAAFQQVLSKYGVASLAIDMRGHGESVNTDSGAKLDYKQFDDVQHLQTLNDVQAALNWLQKKQYSKDRVMLVGASIGANLSLLMLRQSPELAGAVLLSPGDYRGINGVEEALYVKPHHCLWAAGSDGNDPESFQAAEQIVEKAAADRKMFVPYKNSGHGIHLFTADPKLMESLAGWIKESLQMVK